MKAQLIKKEIFEVHKPSGQISSKLTRNGELCQLTPFQHDTLNFMCYNAREQMHSKYKGQKGLDKQIESFETDEDLNNFLSNQEFTMNLNDLAIFSKTYESNRNKGTLSRYIKELMAITVEMGLFKKHDLQTEKAFQLVRRYERKRNSSEIKFKLEPEILIGWVFKTTPYSKMFLSVQTELKHTYTKILYENLKDYQNQGEISKPLTLWNYIFGFNSKSSEQVSTMKRDYLNKSIKEINAKTDIFIDSITGSKKDGEVIMTIKFHKQDCELIDDKEELTVEATLIENKKMNIAKERLEKAKEFQTIKNEEAWLKKTVKSITDEYVETQDHIIEAKAVLDGIDIKEFADLLERHYLDYVGMKDYKLYFLFDETKPTITNNALETMEALDNLE